MWSPVTLISDKKQPAFHPQQYQSMPPQDTFTHNLLPQGPLNYCPYKKHKLRAPLEEYPCSPVAPTTFTQHSEESNFSTFSSSSFSSSALQLASLFPEVLSNIFTYLDKKDKARVAACCSYFNQILKNRQIWKDTVARLNLKPNQPSTYSSLLQRGVKQVQVLSLKRSLRELTTSLKIITHLKLSGCYNVTDSSLASMQPLPSLKELDLSLCKQITDSGLIHILGKCPSLQDLDLGGCCNLTDRSPLLISYGLRSLRKLDLRSCYNLTDKALSYLSGDFQITERHEIKTYNFLAKIGLIDCKLCAKKSSSSSKRIQLPKIDQNTEFGMLSLQTLVLQDCQKISDLSLQSIGKIKSLQSLNLSFCVNITDNGLRHLKELDGSLKELNLRSCDNISDTGFNNLRDCSSIQILDVSFCEKITTLNPTVCKHLTSLSLSACEVGDDALSGIGDNLGLLETLNLGQCNKISDSGLKSIVDKCPNLKYVDLYGCHFTPGGLEMLKKMPKLKNVNLGLWKV